MPNERCEICNGIGDPDKTASSVASVMERDTTVPGPPSMCSVPGACKSL